MSDPVRSTPADGTRLDRDLLYLVGDTQYPYVHLDDSPPRVGDEPEDALALVCSAAKPAVIFHGARELRHALEIGHRIEAFAETVPLELICGAGEDLQRGRVEGEHHTYERLRGALAVLENREGSSEFVEASIRSRSYADGAEAARGHRGEPIFEEAARIVHERMLEAYASVVDGRDRGASFEARYHDDLPFHHAIDHARRARDEGGARFDAIRAQVRDARAQEAARGRASGASATTAPNASTPETLHPVARSARPAA